MRSLSLFNPTFSVVRERDQIYVDKSRFVYELAKVDHGQFFLARPRRFGKSLLVSTFESLFSSGTAQFKGLWIDGKWTDTTYKVLHLDFSGFSVASLASFKTGAVRKFMRVAKRAGLLPESLTVDDIPTPANFIEEICQSAPAHSIVLLIDEYDSPLSANLDNPIVFDELRSELRDFYAAIKEYAAWFRFVFITGVARLKDIAIFSAGSNIADISLNPAMGGIVGYTEDEIRTYFGDYLRRSAALLYGKATSYEIEEQNIERLMDELRLHYDGYCFDANARTHVFQTWSVLRFFAQETEPQFSDFWFQSGGLSKLLVEYFRTQGNVSSQACDSLTCSWDEFNSATTLQAMPIPVLLCQCGYYTIRRADAATVTLGLPNLELCKARARLLLFDVFAKTAVRDLLGQGAGFSAESSPQAVQEAFNAVLSATHSRNRLCSEYQVCDCIRLYFLGTGADVRGEVEQQGGRSDLVFEFARRRVVIEMKYARRSAECPGLLAKAVQQMRARDYGFYVPVKGLRRIAMAYDGESARIACACEA
ncbi:MAG: AAA family ATPase [Duodenibacillus sp.]|nr:AAA family ATPase [Duodenibacillus sp.]